MSPGYAGDAASSAALPAADSGVQGPTCTYLCAACLKEQTVVLRDAIMCKYCAHERGASQVFFKKRLASTSYDTR